MYPLRIAALAIVSALLTACGAASSDPEWQFGPAEVDSALTGSWTGTWTLGGKTGSIELKLARAPSTASKCGSRTFSGEGASAPKCIESTTSLLVGTLTTSDGTFTATPMTGSIMIVGTTFTRGEINLRTTDGKTLFASYQTSSLTDGRVALAGGEATFTLSRPPTR